MDVSKLCPHCMKEMKSVGEYCPYCGKSIKDASAGLHQLNPFTILQGKYLVGSVLGEGGFGITYIGIDMNLEVRVAIKEFYPNGYVSRDHTQTTIVTQFNNSNAEAVRKWKEGFVKEARALGKCQNLPGIVGVKDFFEENGTAYIVMEYVDGTTLKSYIKDKGGKISADELLPAIRPVMSSLQQVHDTGVIHRDISPDNIMFMPDGSMKLLDFGAARSFAEADAQRSLSVMLKPGFAPEEQYRTHGNQGPWSDVYALAATIYRCITGTVPVESMERMRKDTLKSPKELGIKISDQQNAALMKAMAVYAEDRFQSIRDFEKALYEGVPVGPVPTPAPAPVKKEYTQTGGAVSGSSDKTGTTGQAATASDKSKLPLYIGGGAIALILVGAIIFNALNKGSSTQNKTIEGEEAKTTETTEKAADEAAASEEGDEAQVPAGNIWQQTYPRLLETYHGSASAMFTLTDVNGDDIPEMIISDEEGIELVTCQEDGTTDSVSFDEAVCGINERENSVYISLVDRDSVYDYVYKIENGKWTVDQNGSIKTGVNSYMEPDCSYYLEDRSVQAQNYYNWIDDLYRKAGALSDYSFIKVSSGKKALAEIGSSSDMSYYSDASFSADSISNYECTKSMQVFIAPEDAEYCFELKGGAGGADGEHVDAGRMYDGDGALLVGNMSLSLGDKVFILVGGAGDVTSSTRGAMAGGFNGGGDSFWSGGGGGCTELYYRNNRVAAAAGAGGGNYDSSGEPGRESYGSQNYLTGDKFGEGTGYTNDDGSGAGGGAGWRGGTAGSRDGAGHGGINGFNNQYFYVSYESGGNDVSNNSNVDGYARVYKN